jgi:hypothetical protein
MVGMQHQQLDVHPKHRSVCVRGTELRYTTECTKDTDVAGAWGRASLREAVKKYQQPIIPPS